MRSFFSKLFGKANKESTTVFKPVSTQDNELKIATQHMGGEETVFTYGDFEDLKRNNKYDRFLAGQLFLPTGTVVCVDPLCSVFALPQSWSVEKGQYPVYLYIDLETEAAGRVAYAELLVRDEIPVFWEVSLISEEFLTDSLERKINGMYPVDAGLSCFCDYEIFKKYEEEVDEFYKLHKDGNYYNDVLEEYFKENANIPTSSRGEDWINYKLAKANGNIIMFGTGWGDGLYPRYVGYDLAGNVVKMITDFEL